jgi:SAM-dependent methyltransferase
MKIRDSGMPDETLWTTFFDPHAILTTLGLTPDSGAVVDFGCGYGTFTVAAAQITTGIVCGVDIEPDMLAVTQQKAASLALTNVRTIQRDFMAHGTGLESGTIGYAMLFNVLHTANPLNLLREAHRVLAPGGKVAVIHWNYDPATPRGPSMDIRPRPEQCQEWMMEAGFTLVDPLVDLPPYHYSIVGQRI